MVFEHAQNKIEGIKIAYIGGGSRAWANVLMTDLAMEPQLSGTVSLYDIDYGAACENAMVALPFRAFFMASHYLPKDAM